MGILSNLFGIERESEKSARVARRIEADRVAPEGELFAKLQHNDWPTQAECDVFYGNPRGPGGSRSSVAWESTNLVYMAPKFDLAMGSIPITSITIHKLCADSLRRILDYLAVVDQPGKNEFGGSYCYRMMRANSRALSMHAYGAAIDFDPENNAFGSHKHSFTEDSPIVRAFEAEGWVWGGRWSYPDAMHFQAARVR
jgi:hypothetical protein